MTSQRRQLLLAGVASLIPAISLGQQEVPAKPNHPLTLKPPLPSPTHTFGSGSGIPGAIKPNGLQHTISGVPQPVNWQDAGHQNDVEISLLKRSLTASLDSQVETFKRLLKMILSTDEAKTLEQDLSKVPNRIAFLTLRLEEEVKNLLSHKK